MNVVEPGEQMQTPGSLVELARRLRAAEHQHAQNGDLVGGEAERIVEELPVLRGSAPCAAREPRPPPAREALQCIVDLVLVVVDDRIAVRRLVARETECVERQRVLVRSRPLLLEQAAEHPELDGIGVHERSVRCGMRLDVPIRDSYRVAECFLAGEYPGAAETDAANRRLGAFARAGVTLFVDLTHPSDPLEPYERLLMGETRRITHPIVDLGTTTIPRMARILDDIDAAIGEGGTVYVHCWGGIGRTGTVVGCWMMRHGLDGGDPIGRIAELRRDVSDAHVASPQTRAQRAMVRAWKRGR